MRLRSRWAVLVIVLLVAPRRGDAQQLELRVDLDERVNAVYHLTCLAGAIACTIDVFERLWKDRLSWTDADRAAVDAWRETLAKVTSAAPPRPPAPLLGNTAQFHSGQVARMAVLVAAIEAQSAPDLVRRFGGILDAQTAAQATQSIDHVARRIRPWFRSMRPTVARRVGQVKAEARRVGFADIASRMASFLQAELPAPRVYVHAIIGPEPRSTEFSAHLFGNHLAVEVVDAADTKEIVEAGIHELTHYIYDLAPADKHRALIEQFVASGDPSAIGFYTYLNEAVASASVSLRANTSDEPRTEEGSYRNPYIPTLADVAVPLLRTAVASKRTLFDGFVPGYVAAGRSALKEKLAQPQFVLAQVGLLWPDDSDALRAAYVEKMIPLGTVQFRDDSEAATFPDLNLVRVVRYERLGTVGEGIRDVPTLRRHRGFAYVLPRGRGAHTVVLAGQDTAALLTVIERLAELPALEPRGLVLSVD